MTMTDYDVMLQKSPTVSNISEVLRDRSICRPLGIQLAAGLL